MSGKNSTKPYLWLDATSMGADITSEPTDVRYTDNIGIQLIFTGTPAGLFYVQGSIDPLAETDPASAAWSNLAFSTTPEATGAAGNHLINLNQIPYTKIRLFYDRTSGSGALTAYVVKRAIGS
jgi:hypothetical protein